MENGRILIVDDDPTVRSVLSDVLRNVGNYLTEDARDGYEGIQKVRDNDYDLVFSDLTMPGLSGIDFMREARKVRPSLAVVVITGYSTMENAVNAMREGAKDFITKPFSVHTITALAQRIIDERKLYDKIAINNNYESFIGRLNAELFKKLQEISILQSISTELDALYDNKEIYEKIVEMASRLLLVREVSFGLVENGALNIKRAVGAEKRALPISGTLMEHVVRTGGHYIGSFGEANPHTGSPLTVPFFSIPFTINREVFGILNLSNKADGAAFSEEDVSLALTFSKKASQRIENNALYEVFYNNLINTLKALVISIEARDPHTRSHSDRVTAYALQIAEAMKLPAEDIDALRFGGYLHDIGKIGVRDTILLKPGKLTPEEKTEIELHPVIGGNIIKPLRFFPRERELILHHHERFDGTGYPDGLAGDRIPITSRILAVADTYDAMTTSRPYRSARTHGDAIAEIQRCSNSQFDAKVVRAFLQTLAGKGIFNGP